ncbi:HNH endonuclease [Mucilaginibacter flavidus]|uniref:HNH endonuclease n=1 Tax=Mucilaginibacter flavidus TaxID=2949309 RepID=UPI0020937ECD|nr:hypothetical protein [Mucilaginibacter flavidus]MCO5948311.1 hypothetical protein [Mucilaginibacter flavidus]
MINISYNDNNAEIHYLALADQLQTRLGNIIKSRKVTINSVKYYVDNVLLVYLKTLQTESNLKALITARPEKFRGIIKTLRRRIPNILDSTSDSNRVLYNLFIKSGYDDESFKKLDFIERIGMDTCVYCNRTYTFSLEKKKKIKPEIDHFMPKSKYPFLGVSYYNLIPSCQICNGLDAKNQNDPIDYGVRNPYDIKNSDFKFRYEIKTGNVLNTLTDSQSIALSFSKKINGNLKMFKLQELYDKHKDHVVELIVLSKSKYVETYREYLRSYKEKGLKFSDNEIDRMIMGNYVSEIELHKRPLAKLYHDIGKQLGLII